MAELPVEQTIDQGQPQEQPQTVFKDSATGKRIFMPPGLPPEQYMSILQKMRIADEGSRRAGVEKELKTSEAEKQLGAPLERTDTGALKEFEDSSLRFDLARSNQLSEKLRKIRDTYPDLEVKTFDEGGETKIAMRHSGQEGFTLLDSSDLVTLSDITELGGGMLTPEILTSVLATIQTRGMGLVARLVGQAIGGFLGRGLDIGIEQARGYNDDPLKELFTEGSISAFAGAGGEALFAPVRRGVRAVTGGGFLNLTPEEIAAAETAKEAGVRGLTPGQVSPLARRMEQQAAATSKAVQEQRLGQMQDALTDITRIRDEFGDVSALGHDELENLAQRIETDIYALVSNKAVTLERGGRALQEGRKEFVRVWKQHIGDKYNAALEAGENVSFDLRPVQALAQEIKDGILAKAAPIKGETGRFESGTPEQLRVLNQELVEKLDQIIRLNPDMEAFRGNSAFEQIKELRTTFFDMKNAVVQGQEDINNRYAGQIWSSLTDTMNNPKGGDQDFVRLLRSANLSNARFERLLEVQDIKRIALETRPDHLVRSLAQPGNGFALRTLERIIPDEKFTQFRDAFKTALLREPEKIGSVLNNWRPDRVGLRTLLSPNEEHLFRKIGLEMQRLESGPVRDLLEADVRSSDITRRLVTEADVGTIEKIISTAGGKSSKEGRSLAAGLIQSILDQSTEVVRGREVLSANKFISTVGKLEKTGTLQAVLSKEQQDLLKKRTYLASFLETAADPGASIQAAEIGADIAAGLTIPIHPIEGTKRLARGVTASLRNALIGHLFTTDSGRAFFTGMGRLHAGEIQPDMTTLRALSVLSAQAMTRLERTTARPPKQEETIESP